jgi:hypothetical protein
MNFTNSHKPQRSVRWKATLLFISVFVLLSAADRLSIHFGLDGSQQIADDLLGGLIAGSIFYLYERQRLRRFSEQLYVINLTNHHIRNALQPLMFVTDDPEAKAQMELVEECVRRIDWVLREVLPGKSEEDFVTHAEGFAGRSGPVLAPHAGSSSETKRSRPEHTLRGPKPLFRQWLDTWRSRNQKAS